MIEITRVKIFPFEPGALYPDLKAYAEITLNGCLTIKGIKVFEKKNGGIFIGFPAVAGKDKVFREVVVPESPKLKQMIRDRVVAAYKEECL